MTTRLSEGFATAVLLLALISVPRIAWGHWSIVSQLSAREPGRTFDLRLHYEILAGQANPDEALRVCFWLERHQGNRYAPVTGRICQSFTLKPNDWRSFSFAVDTLPWLEDRRPGGKLPVGQYRARALIESDINFIVRFFTGAGQEQKVLPFTVD